MLPLTGWLWCEKCKTPVKLVQCDMVELGAGKAAVVPSRQGRRRN